MWDLRSNRLTLLELLVAPQGLPRRKAQQEAWTHLLSVGWARRTGRQDWLRLENPAAVEELLTRVWPTWRSVWAELQAQELTPDERGMRELERLERERSLAGVQLPAVLNRRTALATVGRHSKVTLSPALQEMLAGVRLTRDGLVRLRPHAGLVLACGSQTLEASSLVCLTGEVVVTERALSDGTLLTGAPPVGIVSVENRGVYMDMPLPPGWLAVHVAGWDSSTLGLLSAQYPGVPWWHFGDLDPNGLAIYRHLAGIRPGMRWFVPSFWEEWLPRGLQTDWPEAVVGPEDPPLVQELARSGKWLEQEVITLDPRLVQVLAGDDLK